ncbi:SMI1/KNR4 family protein [Amycolatopsis circi]|uniref:SMI1/KNR4 family protein n=1 Tax=Amycolatopsis circi TaxID=871959 RepID=UPI000E25733F|nr:SMI1/KNR4 family protein [Amycolatopsis circi]
MDYLQWRDEMRQAIDGYMPRIQAIFARFGELEPDTVSDEVDSVALRKAEEVDPPLPRALLELYASIREASFAHLHNAYFIHSLDLVLNSLHRSDIPAWAPEVTDERLVVFASDGGGRMFAVGYRSGTVFRLPVGAVVDQVYDGSIDSIGPGEIAKDVPDFLTRLVGIAQDFSEEDDEDDDEERPIM